MGVDADLRGSSKSSCLIICVVVCGHLQYMWLPLLSLRPQSRDLQTLELCGDWPDHGRVFARFLLAHRILTLPDKQYHVLEHSHHRTCINLASIEILD